MGAVTAGGLKSKGSTGRAEANISTRNGGSGGARGPGTFGVWVVKDGGISGGLGAHR